MARSGLKTFIRVMGQINRAAEKDRKRRDRLAAQEFRAAEREERRQEREWAAEERQREKEDKARRKENLQAFLTAGQNALASRCKERAVLRDAILSELFS
ncbi:MAG: hypothetical protein LBQ10_07305 [Desulfovibrio sp.]|jgi:hypothetical protein|nr:hypothetical protein [Desulfovibrio sp.]